MRALCSNPALRDIRMAIAGRVICMETIIRELVAADGVRSTAEAFAVVREANATLRVVFSERNTASGRQCLEALDSYLSELTGELGPDFLYQP